MNYCRECIYYADSPVSITGECRHSSSISIASVAGSICQSSCGNQRSIMQKDPKACGQEGRHFKRRAIND